MFVDAETPQAQWMAPTAFSHLSASPSPSTSLQVFRNGMLTEGGRGLFAVRGNNYFHSRCDSPKWRCCANVLSPISDKP